MIEFDTIESQMAFVRNVRKANSLGLKLWGLFGMVMKKDHPRKLYLQQIDENSFRVHLIGPDFDDNGMPIQFGKSHTVVITGDTLDGLSTD